LVTIDVEIAHDRSLSDQEGALWRLLSELADFPATWFCTADAAEKFAEPLAALARCGHTIGCHGLDHAADEDYRKLSEHAQERRLTSATERISCAIGTRPKVFRGPRMTTSVTTQKILRKLRYKADFSACSRRMDLFTASCFDWRWSTTGPDPCRLLLGSVTGDPNYESDELLVVPLSGLGLPLCSGTLYLLGERNARRLVDAIRRTSSQAPIVYLYHSYEFCSVVRSCDRRPIHHRLYPTDPELRYQLNKKFLGYLETICETAYSADTFLEWFDD